MEPAWAAAMLDVQKRLDDDIALVLNALGRGLVRALSIALVGITLLLVRRCVGQHRQDRTCRERPETIAIPIQSHRIRARDHRLAARPAVDEITSGRLETKTATR